MDHDPVESDPRTEPKRVRGLGIQSVMFNFLFPTRYEGDRVLQPWRFAADADGLVRRAVEWRCRPDPYNDRHARPATIPAFN